MRSFLATRTQTQSQLETQPAKLVRPEPPAEKTMDFSSMRSSFVGLEFAFHVTSLTQTNLSNVLVASGNNPK